MNDFEHLLRQQNEILRESFKRQDERLLELERKLDRWTENQAKIREEIATLKTKSAIFGGIFGAIVSAIIAFIVRTFSGH